MAKINGMRYVGKPALMHHRSVYIKFIRKIYSINWRKKRNKWVFCAVSCCSVEKLYKKWKMAFYQLTFELSNFFNYRKFLFFLCDRYVVKVLNVPEKEFMDQMGVCFVSFVSQYGYDRVLSVLGRHMRDFLNGLDNLHEYLKFSYPRMKAPSFICENETKQGLTLHYRSKRRGFVYYTMGQIREVSIIFDLFFPTHTPFLVHWTSVDPMARHSPQS